MLESITRQIFAGIKSRQVRRRDLDEADARRAALTSRFHFFFDLSAPRIHRFASSVQIEREIGLVHAYAIHTHQSNASDEKYSTLSHYAMSDLTISSFRVS